MIDLRLGTWQSTLADVEVDAVITDPPYGRRTHEGQPHKGDDGYERMAIDYSHLTEEQVFEFVLSWSPRCRGWIVGLTSHDLVRAWETAFLVAGRYVFAPVPCVIPGMTVRMSGDGPSSWAVYAVAARPRRKEFLGWGALPGAYVTPRSGGGGGGRSKPTALCEALVRDYSRLGDTIADPFAGWGGFLTAAARLGRKAVGSEVDTEVYAKASGVLQTAHQLALV